MLLFLGVTKWCKYTAARYHFTPLIKPQISYQQVL